MSTSGAARFTASCCDAWVQAEESPPQSTAAWERRESRGAILAAMPADEFVADLKSCIRSAAAVVAEASDAWADHCESVTAKVDFQSKLLEPLLTPLYRTHGYAAALWCAIYTGGWPLGWTDGDWYSMYLCPEYRVCEGPALVASTANWMRSWRFCSCEEGDRHYSASNVLGDVDEATGTPSNFSRVPRRRRRAAAAAPPPPRHRPSRAAP